MLKIDNLNITTLKGRQLLTDFSQVINEGDKTALIGEEGNGKSTLLRIMAGIDVSDYVTWTGNIITRDHIGYLPQSIPAELLNETVLDFITGHKEVSYPRLYELVKTIGIDTSLLERTVNTLSGGEKVRTAMARMLYDDPDILLLDEPTNDLDLETLIWLEEFIRNSDRAIVFISHDETLLRNCATSILHLEQLKRKQEPRMSFSSESYDQYHAVRSHNIDHINQKARKEKAELHRQLERYRQIYQKVEHRQATISRGDPHGAQLLKKKMRSLKAQGRRYDRQEEEMTQKYEPEEAISVFFENIDVNPNKVVLNWHLDRLTAGDRTLAENINLYVKGNERVCIIGANGTGKTTLLKLIRDELKTHDNVRAGYMPQNYEEVLDYRQSADDYLYGICDSHTQGRNLLGAMKFTTEEMSHPMAELSEGQKCKILLAGLILQKCDVLLLDEPTRNLSPLSNPEIRKILTEYDGCIIAVSHDRAFIDEVCDTVYRLTEDGLNKIE